MITPQMPEEANVTPIVNLVVVGGASTSVLGAITDSGAMALVGLGITALTFVMNSVFQLRRDQREEALYKLQVSNIRKE